MRIIGGVVIGLAIAAIVAIAVLKVLYNNLGL